MMKLKIESKSEGELSFVLNEAPLAFANLLRRSITRNVPVFAIEDVVFYENNSAFFDEYISHRLGLIPLTTPSKVKKDDEVELMIDVEGPKTVYSKDLKSSDKSVKPTLPNIPIIKLADGQHVRIESKAVLGTGSQHAKFQPGLATYGYDEEGTFRFYIESFGQMPTKTILERALSSIKERAEEIEESIGKAKGD
jgi:DNA-directed RNA polymerase subunit D